MDEVTAEQMAQLRRHAQAGDARGQYLLAGILSQQDQAEEAGMWLRRSAESNYPDALFTLGTWHFTGEHAEKDLEKGYGYLVAAFEAGLRWLAPLLGALNAIGYGTEANWVVGLDIVGKAAQEGQPSSLLQIAMLTAIRTPDHPIITPALQLAAQQNEPFAMFALADRKLEDDDPDAQAEGWYWLDQAASRNHPLAHLMVAKSRDAVAGGVKPDDIGLGSVASFDWDSLLEELWLPPIPEPPASDAISEDPKIARFPEFLSRAECGHLVFQAFRYLTPSGTIHPVTGEVVETPIRTSADATFWPINQDLVVHAINCRVAEVTGDPWTHQEMLCVLFYEPGQEYKPHHDFLVPDKEGRSEQLEQSGQRKGTFLVYLNEDYEGGETEFLNLDLKFRGAQGEALFFTNMLADGSGDERTLHTGLPVASGNKWLATKWIREKPFVY